ncbi:periplasmic heavy metal sensor [bacterium]|nr:periplasmic heavy metal sensor [bacterium]
MNKHCLFGLLCALMWLSLILGSCPAQAQEPDTGRNEKVWKASGTAGEVNRHKSHQYDASVAKRVPPGSELNRINTPEAHKIRKKYQSQMNVIHAEMRELRGACAKELSKEKPNKETVKAYVVKISDLRCRQQKLLVDQMFEILDSLPKEKRSEYLQPFIDRCLK